MAIESGYVCSACGAYFASDFALGGHLAANPTHSVREAFSDTVTRTTWPAPGSVYAGMLDALITRNGVAAVDALANLSQTIYATVGNIPIGNIALNQWAMVFGAAPNDGLLGLAFSQAGEVTWTNTDWPHLTPPNPLGTWVINADDNSIGSGTGNWEYWMGTEFRIKAAGNGLAWKRVAFKDGLVGTHNWEIRKSTVIGAGAPALTTYTTIAASGSVALTPNVWGAVTLGAPITIATNEWYIIWHWVGPAGGHSVSTASLVGAQKDETYAAIIGGVYRQSPGALPGGASSPPQARLAGTLYGISTGGIG